ncbi:MAG TPA: RagB/SusD family nutrient uptake outer membrane protein [Puia sp.]|nr:RagB/SusD family nutrient uptake outer membrane protein [Puia sp.]
MKMIKMLISRLCIVVYVMVFGSCQKFVDIGAPKTKLVGTNVFTNDQTATAAMTGIYGKMMGNNGSFLNTELSLLGGLSADEFVDYSGVPIRQQFYQNALSTGNSEVFSLWSDAYNYIYQANAILGGIKNAAGISVSVKKELEGEAKCIRAICYFYLLNFYGDVPLAVTTSYQVNTNLSRLQPAEIYQQIISDCEDAQNLLPEDFSFSNGERVRPNHFAATALLARAYLFMKDWKNAEIQADSIINRSDLFTLPVDLNLVFLANSSEAIWQLEPVQPGLNTIEGNSFILTAFPNSVALSDSIVKAFEPGDGRRLNWIDSIVIDGSAYYFPFKYKVQTGFQVTEYCMVLRLAEQYLIRAEARAEQGNLTGAADDLNLIRNRAGLSNTLASDQNDLLAAIQQERRVELFTEDATRWLDLIRTGKASQVLSNFKNDWKTTDTLYPIPLSELQNDTRLTQNPGY